jgi:hypothetical protein
MNRLAILTLAALFAVSAAAGTQDRKKDPRNDAQRDAIMQKLDTMRIDVNFEGETFNEVIQYFQEYTGLNWLIDPEVDMGDEEVTLKLKGVTIRTALKLILKELELAAMYKEGMIVIVTKDQVNYAVYWELYDVRDLFIKVSNFPGPRLELLPGAGAGGGPGVSFTLEEPVESKIDEGMLEDIIRSTTGGETWDENEHAQIQLTPNGMLLIAQTREVHRQIKRLINMLRWFR